MKAGFFQSFPWRLGAVSSGIPNLLSSVPRLDTRPPYMAMYPTRRGVRKVSRTRRSFVPRYTRPYTVRSSDQKIDRYTRHSNLNSVALVAGTAGYLQDVKLSNVYTADIQGTWSFYRIMGVTAIITPRVDPGNQGINPNGQVHCWVANDQQGEFPLPTSVNSITQYENQKYQNLVAGKSMFYRFYPKMTNTVDNAGVAAGVGGSGKYNDWIRFDGPGVSIPHYRFLMWLATPLASTQSIDIVLKVSFQVKGRT